MWIIGWQSWCFHLGCRSLCMSRVPWHRIEWQDRMKALRLMHDGLRRLWMAVDYYITGSCWHASESGIKMLRWNKWTTPLKPRYKLRINKAPSGLEWSILTFRMDLMMRMKCCCCIISCTQKWIFRTLGAWSVNKQAASERLVMWTWRAHDGRSSKMSCFRPPLVCEVGATPRFEGWVSEAEKGCLPGLRGLGDLQGVGEKLHSS